MDNIQTMAYSNSLPTHGGISEPAPRARRQNHSLALDLNQLLVRQPSSTYLLRINGHHWADQGVYDGDVAVIDRAIQAGPRDLLVTGADSDAKLCRQHQLTANDRPWGVVTAVIHQYRTP